MKMSSKSNKEQFMAAMISFRSTVDPSDCDFLGHMKVSRYFAA